MFAFIDPPVTLLIIRESTKNSPYKALSLRERAGLRSGRVRDRTDNVEAMPSLTRGCAAALSRRERAFET